MLDVHAPHAATHTWQDFLLHIATICVGLLIAIGLEQSVEAVHHRHQRHELQAQLHDEAGRNLALAERNLTRLGAQIDWMDANIRSLNAAPATAGRVSASAYLDTNHIFDTGMFEPSQATWAAAKANGTIALLPEDEAQVYSRLDHEGDVLQQGDDYLTRALFESRVDKVSTQGLTTAQTASFAVADRDRMVHELALLRVKAQYVRVLEINEAGACRGVLEGAHSVDQMLQIMLREFDTYKAQNPGKLVF